MLSKELRDLEINQLVTRTVYDTKPVTVEYEMTPYGRSLDRVLEELKELGHSAPEENYPQEMKAGKMQVNKSSYKPSW